MRENLIKALHLFVVRHSDAESRLGTSESSLLPEIYQWPRLRAVQNAPSIPDLSSWLEVAPPRGEFYACHQRLNEWNATVQLLREDGVEAFCDFY